MVELIEDFTVYGQLPRFHPEEDYFQLRGLPEVGLGKILAVAAFINDIDVTGGGGANIGYKRAATVDGRDYVQSYKIDPGEAFNNTARLVRVLGRFLRK